MSVRSFFSAAASAVELLCLICFFCCGCSLFRTAPDHVEKVPGTDPVSLERARIRKENNTLYCLIAETGTPFARYSTDSGEWEGIEPELIRALAAEMKMQVQFIAVPLNAVSGALRNGRGDIAAAQLDTEQIRMFYLTSVFPYLSAGDDGEKYAFMVRSGDLQWQEKLSDAAKKINAEQIVNALKPPPSAAAPQKTAAGAKVLPVVPAVKPGKDGKK